MEEAKTILVAEAGSYLSLERHPADHGVASPQSDASHQLSQLKRRVSSELGKHIEILVTDFDDMREEQRILVAKITDLTQLYLNFKRQRGKLETESTELKSALQTLHSQLKWQTGYACFPVVAQALLSFAVEADALPRISKRNGEKGSGIVPQLFSSEAVRDHSTPTNRTAALASKYGITIPKSVGYRGGKGASTDVSQKRERVGLFTMKQVPKEQQQQQQRPLSTRALPKKPLFNTGLDAQPFHPTTTLSSPKTFAEWGDGCMQQPQQVEAAKPSPSQSFSTSRKALDATRDFQRSSTTDMESVRSENETLRLEIANLKGELVEKMQGGGKIVAGGQFRGSSYRGAKSAQSSPSEAASSSCSSCSSMRLTLKKSRNAYAQNQQITEGLHQEIAKMEAIQYTLWGENSAHVSEIKELRDKLDQMERCQALTDGKAQVLQQQSPIEAQNFDYHDPELNDNNEVIREMVDAAVQFSPRESNRVEEEVQYGYLQDEVKRLWFELANCEQDKKVTSERWLNGRNSFEQQRGECAEYYKRHAQCDEDNERRLTSLTQMLESSRQNLASLQELRAMETVEHHKLREKVVQLRKALEHQEARACQLEKESQETAKTNTVLQTQITRLESQGAAHSRESIRLLPRLKDLEAMNSALSTENKQLHAAMQQHVKEIGEHNQSSQNLKIKVNELEMDLGILKKKNTDSLQMLESNEAA